MRMIRLTAAALVAMAMTELALPVNAGPGCLSSTTPRGKSACCYPDNKDNKMQVVCTPATKLP
jgi:small neutral amino acid transporter SnatA (MarC family)